MKIRINNIGAEKAVYIGKPPKNADLEVSIVKYHPNRYYGELETYIKDGWKDCGSYVESQGNNPGIILDKNLFNRPEGNYVIASLKYNKKEDCTELTSVCDRLLHIENEDKEDFWEVYRLADNEMIQRFSNEQENSI
jgi:hypothetical protein